MESPMKKLITLLLVSLAAVLLLVQDGAAIPAFARKYDMSCSTCHAPFPKLKPFGDEFAGNGFRLPDQEPARFLRETGDDGMLLMREIPLAMRFEGWLNFEKNGTSRTDVQMPWVAKILSGGLVTKTVSYYMYFLMNERGEVVGLEDAFVMFNDLFGQDLDLYAGQFQVSDPLFKRELRLTKEDYSIYNTDVGDSRAGLTYDRGLMLTYSLPTKTDIIVEVLNGNGIGESDHGMFDNDANKNFMLRLSQDVGEHLRIGVFGYSGSEDRDTSVNATAIYGPDLTLSFEPLELNLQYVMRSDDRPDFTVLENKKKTEGAFAELVYSPGGDRSDWYGVLLYNWVKSEYPGLEYESVTANANYMLGRNMRLVGEYTYNATLGAHRLGAGFVVAF